MTVKRSPYRVGQKLTVPQFKAQAPRFDNPSFPSGTGGFVIKEVHKTSHTSGGYIFTAESVRLINGERMKATWILTFPSFRRSTVKTPYFTSLRFWTGDGFTQADDEKPFIPTLKADINEQRKHTDAGERNGKMVLADFLEE